ncbi:hypothetical protein [Pseudomonas syringae group genomosp. 3]|uniref:hypothetical protein n=1 Tax=Pseudomonas syringae group genomosp. 3 TaxID=251701 RepID=UPI000F4092DB|nr:hypothetical protein [Pseudomonas syringae group genomosp. 3]RMR29592.1 hypothetical protein ALP87_102435 [Pseudomonas syringae pv. coriandricola]
MDKAVIDLLKRRVIDSGKQRHGADSARTGNLRREVDGLAAAVRAARSRFPPSTGQLRQIESKQFEPFLSALA